MRKRSRKASSKKEASQVGSYQGSAWCCQLFSLLFTIITLIIVLLPNFYQTVGRQGVRSSSLTSSVTWLNGVRADKNPNEKHPVSSRACDSPDRHQESTYNSSTDDEQKNVAFPDLTSETNICDSSKFGRSGESRCRHFYFPTQRDSKCSSSFNDFFVRLAFPVCSHRARNSGFLVSKRAPINSPVKKVAGGKVAIESSFSGSGSPERDREAANHAADQAENLQNDTLKPPAPSPAQSDVDCRGSSEEGKMNDGGQDRDATSTKNISADANGTDSTLVGNLPTGMINGSHLPLNSNFSNISVRQEPGDGPYNYASDSKGAKILASNKEAKGASNILNKDKDKYLRTPCSVEAKFVVIELSEETLVVRVTIANHEFYASSVKEFELWGSKQYPTEEWDFLGKFEAENTRVPQTFTLSEPKWVRYLRILMLNHYGSDFYCTFSAVEVHGVDAIEWLLEDWIAEEVGAGARTTPVSQEETAVSGSERAGASVQVPNQVPDERETVSMPTTKGEEIVIDKGGERSEIKGKPESYNPRDASKPDKGQTVQHQSGRPALDGVMKLLMQKVRSLEHNQPLLSQYLEEQDDRYEEVFKGFERELALMTDKLGDAATQITSLTAWLQIMEEKWMREKEVLENNLLNEVEAWNSDLESLRKQLKKMENKEMVALTVALLSIMSVVMMQMLMVCIRLFKAFKPNETRLSTCSQALWGVPFLSCGLVVFVLSM